MARSIKKNYLLNLVNSGTQILFPLISFPYVARIMMADGIGLVNFYGSIIQYIILACGLGIPLYGVREVARVRSDSAALQQTTVELLTLSTLLSLVGYAVVGLLCLTVGRIQENIPLFLIISMNLFFTTIGCEWFYQGTEDFGYITLRGIIVKTISLVFLFVFVRSKSHLLLYGLYTVLGTLGGNIFNFIRLRKYVHLREIRWKSLSLQPHLKASLAVFLFTVVSSVYLQLSTVLLGFMQNDAEVGYYGASMKLVRMIMMVSSAFGVVMLPRLSNLVAEKRMDEFRQLSPKAFEFMVFLTLPMAIGVVFESPYLIPVMCGPGFEPSITVLMITAPIIFAIGLSNVLGMQIFYPLGKIGLVNLCTGIGAVGSLTINLLLIPRMGAVGSAIATLAAESAVTLSMFLIGRDSIPFKLRWNWLSDYVIGAGLMALVLVIVCRLVHLSDFWMLILVLVTGVTVYCGYLALRGNGFYLEAKNKLLGYLKRGGN